jgi:hypothetical protein
MHTETTETTDNKGRLFLLLAALLFGAFVYMRWKWPLEQQVVQHAATLLGPEPPAVRRAPLVERPFTEPTVVQPKYTTSDTRLLVGQSEKNTAEQLSFDDIGKGVANAVAAVVGDGSGKSDVVQVKASSDRNHYFVAANLPHKGKAANKLAEVNRRAQYLLQALDEQLDGNKRIMSGDGKDITESMKRIVKKHFNKPVPLAEYHNPDDLTVGSNSGKGQAIETCLRGKRDPSDWAPDNTLFRVHTHELAHSGDTEYRGDGEDAHGPVFKRIHMYLLTVAENLRLYNCAEYKKSGKMFCGVTLSEDYCAGGGGPTSAKK